jgi:hypothetical protein
MLGFIRAIKFGFAVLAVSVMLTGTSTPVRAATGSVRIIISRANFIVGGGSGTLHFAGKRYQLRVGGVSIGPFGAPRIDLVGRAYHMRTAASIHGIYSTMAPTEGRPTIIRLQNWQGVVLELRGRGGAKPSVDLGGLQISLR